MTNIHDSGWIDADGEGYWTNPLNETSGCLRRFPKDVMDFKSYIKNAKDYFGSDYRIRCVELKDSYKTYYKRK